MQAVKIVIIRRTKGVDSVSKFRSLRRGPPIPGWSPCCSSAQRAPKRSLQHPHAVIPHIQRAEGALHLEDILARRMRISIGYPHRGVARVEAEVRSQQEPDDESADALRAAAPEARAEILEPGPLN